MKGTSWVVHQSKYNVADVRHLENRYDVIFPQWIFRFGRNFAARCRITLITAKWSRSKPEEQFQYGGRSFFKNGSSHVSAVNRGMSTKFGLLIYFDLLKAATSTNTKLKVKFSDRGRHLDKWIWRHISAVWVIRFWRNLVAWCRITCGLGRNGGDRNRKQNSNLVDVCYSKTEVVISQPWILLLVCVSWTITGQPQNSVFIRRF